LNRDNPNLAGAARLPKTNPAPPVISRVSAAMFRAAKLGAIDEPKQTDVYGGIDRRRQLPGNLPQGNFPSYKSLISPKTAMNPNGRATMAELTDVANRVLAEAPADALPSAIAQSLGQPTIAALRDAAAALVAGERFELAEMVFRAFADRPDAGPWASAGLAKVLARRGESEAAVVAWRDCLGRFADRVQPHWLIELARSERELGRAAEAEATLRRCSQSYPQFAPGLAALADLLAKTGRPAEAVAAWRTAIRDCRDAAQPWWFQGLASALRGAGAPEQAEVAREEMVRRFPKSAAVLAMQARAAAERQQWDRALGLWTECLQRHPTSTAPDSLNGRAKALFRLWRIEEALEIWRDLIDRFPDFVAGYAEMGAAALELGDFAAAQRCYSAMIARFPDKARPEWYARLARSLNEQRMDRAAGAVLAELESRFPDSPLACRDAYRFSFQMEFGLDSQSALIEDALRRFPGDRGFLAARVVILLAFGRLAEAEKIVEALEAAEDDYYAVVSRWRFKLDRSGGELVERTVQRIVLGRPWPLEAGLPLGRFLLELWLDWAAELASALFDDLAKRFPNQVEVFCTWARALIATRQDRLALELTESIPLPYQTSDVLELRAWAAAQRGEDDRAKQVWKSVLSRRYFPALHRPAAAMNRLTREDRESDCGDVTAFIVFRNESTLLPEFLRHHRNLGVRRFVFVDYMSSDDSSAILMNEPGVILYRCDDSFQLSSAGMRWKNELIERHGGGGWILHVDVDEMFIYPGWETTPLSRLTEYLDGERMEALSAFMLDVFPRRMFDEAGAPTRHSEHRCYDGDYAWMGLVTPPYRRPAGGVRARLFQAQEYLHKVPLIKSSCGVALNSHETTHLRFADVTGALLHYKLLNLAIHSKQRPSGEAGNPFVASDRSGQIMRRHQRYMSRLASLRDVDLFKAGVSEELADSLTLADRGLMRASPKYRDWLQSAHEPPPLRADSQTASAKAR
jgi:TolA-binding protein